MCHRPEISAAELTAITVTECVADSELGLVYPLSPSLKDLRGAQGSFVVDVDAHFVCVDVHQLCWGLRCGYFYIRITTIFRTFNLVLD